MNNSLQSKSITVASSEGTPYFIVFMQQAYEKGFMDAALLEKIQMQSVALLAKRVERFTFGESSSVLVTKAEEILHSIFYTAGIALEKIHNDKKAITVLREEGLEALYTIGRSYIDERVISAKQLLQKVQESAVSVYHHAYHDTVFSGLPQFFNRYDADFGAQMTPCSIDYPLSCPISQQTGVSYICSYLESLLIENRFCRKFSDQDVEALLRGYEKDYAEQFFNIFDLVIANACGCLLAQKDVLPLLITDADRNYLQQQLEHIERQQLANQMTEIARRLCDLLDFENEAMRLYVADAMQKLLPILRLALEEKRLEAVLITPRHKAPDQPLRFVPAPAMEDEAFRQLTDELRSCRFVEDKIRLIQRQVKSHTDLCDLLAAGCLFNNEFDALFSVLQDEQLALFYHKSLADSAGREVFLTEEERLWQKKLLSFYQGLPVERKRMVEGLASTLS